MCFYNGLKSYQVNIYKICGKIVRNGYKSTYMEYCVKSTINSRGILPIFNNYLFRTDRSTKHFIDRVSADYIGYYMQGSGKSDKYGFFGCLPEKNSMRLDVFLNSSTKFNILSRFSLSNDNLMVKNSQVGLINHICFSF